MAKKRKKKKRRLRKKIKKIMRFIMRLTIFIIIFALIINLLVKENEITIMDNENKNKQKEICLQEKFNEKDLTEKIVAKINELNEYFKNKYNVSIGYKDLNLGFEFNYNEEKKYYAASTIKMLDALYIYTNASEGNINLNDKLLYESKFEKYNSAGLSKHEIGEKISIRDITKYAIIYSDNGAHEMLVNYIGKNNLKKFGENLGAKFTMYGQDNYGTMTVGDALIYTNKLYEFAKNDELGEELLSYFLESDENYLKIDEKEIKAATKYGLYGENFHQNGIILHQNPYIISILTLHAKDDYKKIVKEINEKIFELHNLFYENRNEICNNE